MPEPPPRGPRLSPTFERTPQFNENVEQVRAVDPDEADQIEAAVAAIVVDPGRLFPVPFEGQMMEAPAVTPRISILVAGTYFEPAGPNRRRLHIVFDAVLAMDPRFDFLHREEPESGDAESAG